MARSAERQSLESMIPYSSHDPASVKLLQLDCMIPELSKAPSLSTSGMESSRSHLPALMIQYARRGILGRCVVAMGSAPALISNRIISGSFFSMAKNKMGKVESAGPRRTGWQSSSAKVDGTCCLR